MWSSKINIAPLVDLMQVKLLIRNENNEGYLISRTDFLEFIRRLKRIERTLAGLKFFSYEQLYHFSTSNLLSMTELLSQLETEISLMPKFILAGDPKTHLNPVAEYVNDTKLNIMYQPSMQDKHRKACFIFSSLSKFLLETEKGKFSEYLKSYRDERDINLYKEALIMSSRK